MWLEIAAVLLYLTDNVVFISGLGASRSSWVRCLWISSDRRGRHGSDSFSTMWGKSGRSSARTEGRSPHRYHCLCNYHNSSSVSISCTSCMRSQCPDHLKTSHQRPFGRDDWAFTWRCLILCAFHQVKTPSLHTIQMPIWESYPPEQTPSKLGLAHPWVPQWSSFKVRIPLGARPRSASLYRAQTEDCWATLPPIPTEY